MIDIKDALICECLILEFYDILIINVTVGFGYELCSGCLGHQPNQLEILDWSKRFFWLDSTQPNLCATLLLDLGLQFERNYMNCYSNYGCDNKDALWFNIGVL